MLASFPPPSRLSSSASSSRGEAKEEEARKSAATTLKEETTPILTSATTSTPLTNGATSTPCNPSTGTPTSAVDASAEASNNVVLSVSEFGEAVPEALPEAEDEVAVLEQVLRNILDEVQFESQVIRVGNGMYQFGPSARAFLRLGPNREVLAVPQDIAGISGGLGKNAAGNDCSFEEPLSVFVSRIAQPTGARTTSRSNGAQAAAVVASDAVASNQTPRTISAAASDVNRLCDGAGASERAPAAGEEEEIEAAPLPATAIAQQQQQQQQQQEQQEQQQRHAYDKAANGSFERSTIPETAAALAAELAAMGKNMAAAVRARNKSPTPTGSDANFLAGTITSCEESYSASAAAGGPGCGTAAVSAPCVRSAPSRGSTFIPGAGKAADPAVLGEGDTSSIASAEPPPPPMQPQRAAAPQLQQPQRRWVMSSGSGGGGSLRVPIALAHSSSNGSETRSGGVAAAAAIAAAVGGATDTHAFHAPHFSAMEILSSASSSTAASPALPQQRLRAGGSPVMLSRSPRLMVVDGSQSGSVSADPAVANRAADPRSPRMSPRGYQAALSPGPGSSRGVGGGGSGSKTTPAGSSRGAANPSSSVGVAGGPLPSSFANSSAVATSSAAAAPTTTATYAPTTLRVIAQSHRAGLSPGPGPRSGALQHRNAMADPRFCSGAPGSDQNGVRPSSVPSNRPQGTLPLGNREQASPQGQRMSLEARAEALMGTFSSEAVLASQLPYSSPSPPPQQQQQQHGNTNNNGSFSAASHNGGSFTASSHQAVAARLGRPPSPSQSFQSPSQSPVPSASRGFAGPRHGPPPPWALLRGVSPGGSMPPAVPYHTATGALLSARSAVCPPLGQGPPVTRPWSLIAATVAGASGACSAAGHMPDGRVASPSPVRTALTPRLGQR